MTAAALSAGKLTAAALPGRGICEGMNWETAWAPLAGAIAVEDTGYFRYNHWKLGDGRTSRNLLQPE